MDQNEFLAHVILGTQDAIEAMLIGMPVRFTLCVHGATWSDTPDTNWPVMSSTTMHTMTPWETCDLNVVKNQYGPKTQAMQDEIDQGKFK
jgi:hypothetical protein